MSFGHRRPVEDYIFNGPFCYLQCSRERGRRHRQLKSGRVPQNRHPMPVTRVGPTHRSNLAPDVRRLGRERIDRPVRRRGEAIPQSPGGRHAPECPGLPSLDRGHAANHGHVFHGRVHARCNSRARVPVSTCRVSALAFVLTKSGMVRRQASRNTNSLALAERGVW